MARGTGILAVLLACAAATAGCGGSAAQPPATAASATADDETSSSLAEHHRFHHHGGVTLFIALSLDTLGVSPEQRAAVEKIRVDLHARMEPARLAEQGLLAALADGVAAGSIDTTKVDAAVAQVAASVATVHDASTDALDALHDVLTPLQRATLVDKVESQWAVWQNANAEAPARPGASHLEALATDLELTPDQVEKIRASLGGGVKGAAPLDRQVIATHIRAFGDAFRGDKFEAKALTTASGANGQMAGWGAAHLAHFIETVSPQLTPEQRALLAQRLREHASHNPSAPGNQ